MAAFREDGAIDQLTANLPMASRELARSKVRRTLDQARELGRLQDRFRAIAAELDQLEPCALLMGALANGGHPDGCRWCSLLTAEQRTTRRIDDLRRMLGGLP